MIPTRRYTREIHQPNRNIYKTLPHVNKEADKTERGTEENRELIKTQCYNKKVTAH